MSKTTTEIPYTELVERVIEICRLNYNAIGKARGVVQDIYTRDIPTKWDWTFLFASSAITTIAQYNVGTVSATTGQDTVSFSSDVVLIDSMNRRKIKFTSNQTVYEITSIGTATVQISPTFLGDQNILNGGYTIFQPVYALAGDFDRFPKDGGMYKWTGGEKKILPEEPYQEYTAKFASNPSEPDKIRIVGVDTAGNTLVEFRPAPKDARVISYDYYRQLKPMAETTAGTLSSIPAKSTVVSGYPNTRFLDAGSDSTVKNYLRVDVFGTGVDSGWYPIINIANDSGATLRTAFANSAVTGSANYTICNAPNMPTMLHPAILYGACAQMFADQSDEMAQFYVEKYMGVIQDAKKLYVSRVYSQDIHGIQEDWNYRR